MGMPLTEREIEFLDRTENSHILTPVRDYLVDLRSGAIHICCLDPAHFHEWYGLIATIATRQHGEKPNVGPLSFAGGPLAVDPRSPINLVADHTPVIKFSLDLLYAAGYRRVVLHGHAGCRAAHDLKIDLHTNISLIVSGKQYIEERYKGMEAFCFFHVKHPTRGDLHNHIATKRWLEAAKTLAL